MVSAYETHAFGLVMFFNVLGSTYDDTTLNPQNKPEK
jgi:hypothetical protein